MNNPLGVSPSKGKTGNHTRQRKNLLTSVGIKPTTSGLDLPSLCRLLSRQSDGKSNPEVVGSIPTEVKRFFLCLVWFPVFPLLGLTPSGLFMGLCSTIIFRVNSLFHYSCSQCYAAQHSYVPLIKLHEFVFEFRLINSTGVPSIIYL